MSISRPAQQICTTCSSQLLFLFRNGFSSTSKFARPRSQAWNPARLPARSHLRTFASAKGPRSVGRSLELNHNEVPPPTSAQLESVARQARQTFGETLPTDFLTAEEYSIYERLYGPPLGATRPDDVRLLQGSEEEHMEEESDVLRNVLLREDEEGNLEEMEYNQRLLDEAKTSEEPEIIATEEETFVAEGDGFKARYALFRDIAAAQQAELLRVEAEKAQLAEQNAVLVENQEDVKEDVIDEVEEDQHYEDPEAENDVYSNSDYLRTHPSTAAGRSGTSPATLRIPQDTVVDPVTRLLANASNKHLTQIAHEKFGGPGLPNSTATPISKGILRQSAIALEASQIKMGPTEANAYLAAIMPGAYATVMGTLVEVRKRLGSEWLNGLLNSKDGPSVLDAGTGGAAVQAWREILRAEWELQYPDGVPVGKSAPLGKATVVAGSSELRHRTSQLLENTMFVPRLSDYDPALDDPTIDGGTTAQPRKRYDIIIAPHTLWALKEDYMRKNRVQNFWSLLKPNGGVLILIEKGVPRGFELIAGARETLLKHYIKPSPAHGGEIQIREPLEGLHRPKEDGMIIAPCTNHFQCPMYTVPGRSNGRKDFCHFQQRYTRPHYLQRILGAGDKNHEDIRYSYVAVQRGVDQRQKFEIMQGQPATEAAFTGYGDTDVMVADMSEESRELIKSETPLHPLSLPRTMLSPIKRHGHVVLDVCTPAGRLERWTVPKSYGRQAYRDARKSQWGDLWALGAKTRVPRNIRLGNKPREARGKHVYELDAGDKGHEELRHVSGPNARFEKRTKRGRTERSRPRKTLVEEDI